MDQAPHHSRALKFGVFEVDLEGGELRKSGVRQKLSGQPFEVLRILLEHPQQVVTRDELRKHLWPEDTFVDYDLGLKKAVNRIREVLGDDAGSPRFIETIPRRGYRFIGALQNGAQAAASPQTVVTQAPPETVPTEHKQKGLPWAASLGLTTIVVLALGLYFVWRHFHSRAQPPAGKIMLAVLPFQNFTGDPSQEYFSDGFTEEMITALGGLQPERLGVIARTSAMKYKHTDKAVDQIGRELGVQYVLEGSVRRDADRTRISAQLIQVQDQSHLWAETYQRDPGDIFRVQSEVAEAIAGQIRLRLTAAEQARLAAARPVDPQAHEAYLLGRFYLMKRTHDAMLTALGYFQKSVSLDPNDPLGYAGIADSYIALSSFEYLPATEAFPLAKEAVLKALALDDTLVSAHSTLGQIYISEFNWEGGERESKRAIALNPNDALVHERYSTFLSRAGRHADAVAEGRRARELDPLSALMPTVLGQTYLHARRFDEAQQALLKAQELDASFLSAHILLADTYAAKGMLEDSLAEIKKAASISPEDAWVRSDLGYVYAKLRRKSDAEKVLDELRAESRRRYVSPFYLSWIYIGLGQNDEALQCLERAYQQKDFQIPWIGVAPVFDPLRSDPRFADLVRRAVPPSSQ